MLISYFQINFLTLMILLALVSLMYMNRDVKIPATKLFIMCVALLIALTLVATLDTSVDVSGLSAAEAARVVTTRRVMSTLGYIIRPCVILAELLIIFEKSKYRMLLVIPAVINAGIYLTALFGSHLAFWIDENNSWHGGPLKLTIYITLMIYLLVLLLSSVYFFREGDRQKSIILVVIFTQAVLVAIREYYNGATVSYTNEIMALGTLEYYIYLATVYRQELKEKLDAYVSEMEETDNKLKSLTTEVIEALASAIDAKDTYTHGHASRVAEYSRKLAELNGKSKKECDEIYYAALLHDVGKIGVSDSIITKNGKLTLDEYEQIKKHTVLGTQILQRISEFPYLSTGAVSHHERYDGTGYPAGMKGTDIPEAARIISVADAYDAMSSKRSYRDPIPQQIVREEIVKGIGTQFDPEYARLMLHLIDVDTEYEMRERQENTDISEKDELVIGEYRSKVSKGILITAAMATLRMIVDKPEDDPDAEPVPSLILFDSLDSRVHDTEKEKQSLNYFEYGQIWFDGRTETTGARKIQATITDYESLDVAKRNEYKIEAVKIKDHVLIRIFGEERIVETIVALPDNARFLYLGLTGEHCRIRQLTVIKAKDQSPDDLIPRIADEISYIDVPAGEVPNVQIDGYRTNSTEGFEVKNGLQISFHTMTLPTGRLVWHCPIVDIYCADDGKVNGKNYRDLAFMNFEGEAWGCDPACSMKLESDRLDSFEGWDEWKDYNHAGYDAVVSFETSGNKIIINTENAGISIKSTIELNGINKRIYAAITGDQVAITDIHVKKQT